MIDIHTHILPNLDDGSRDLDESLAMARMAVAEGITGMIATPHHANGRYINEAARVREEVKALQFQLVQHDIPLQLYAGQEIRIYPTLLEDLDAGKLLTLAGSPYLLLELPPNEVPPYTAEMIYEMRLMGVTPVIAHPERNRELLHNARLLDDLVEGGALCQVTTHSVSGLFGKQIQHAALSLCRRNVVHFLSSDAHNMSQRAFLWNDAYNRIRKNVGQQTLDYFLSNAQCVVNAVEISPQESIRPDKTNILSKLFFMIR